MLKSSCAVLAMICAVFFNSGSLLADGVSCAAAFSSNPEPTSPLSAWRNTVTNLDPSGTSAATSKTREVRINAYIKAMEKSVLVNESTPLMAFFAAEGVKWTVVVDSPGYQSGIVTRIQVSNLGDKSSFKGTLLLPVSGHKKAEMAKIWAQTDTYSILHEAGGLKKTLVSNAKSLGVVTVQELDIPLIKDKVVKVSYYRSGSLGPSGFLEGRVIEFIWDGT